MRQTAITEYWSSLAARYRASPMPGFLRWWGGELSALLPATLKQRMIPPKPVIWLLADAQGQGFSAWTGGAELRHAQDFGADEDAEVLRHRWQALVADFADGEPEVRLCLAPSEVLRRPVELPLAVEANLAESIRYQLDLLTPFRADQTYFDHRVTGRNAEHGLLHVDLCLATRPRVDELLAQVARFGARPHAVDCALDGKTAGGEGFNLLPPDTRPRYVHRRVRINWILAGVLALLLALVMFESLFLHQRSVDRLRGQVAALRTQADEVMNLQQELEDSLVAANFLADRRRRQPPSLEVISELGRVLPADMWIRQMQMESGELRLEGLANEAQELIGAINESPLLTDAEFRGSVRIDPSSGREQFSAIARIKLRGGEHAAAAQP